MASSVLPEKIRRPAVAGMFYPAHAQALSAAVSDCLAAVREPHTMPKALIAPHAGYMYSGPIAGTAYAPFADRDTPIRRVVLLGPSHRVAFRGLAASGAHAFLTPLGAVPIDQEAISRILPLPGVSILDEAHALEHSLEVHLPFLQRLFPSFTLVPIVVGDADSGDVDRVLETLWGGPETLIVVSSDLSHYHDYETARGLDAAASRAIETYRSDLLREEQACGRRPILGLLGRARTLDMRATTIDLRNSGDTAGDRDRVVGYGAYAFEYASQARLSDAHRTRLKNTAAASIRHGIGQGGALPVDPEDFPWPLRARRASFVTVELDGKLRGCIGSLTPDDPLIVDVALNAHKASFSDPRFPPVSAEEAARLKIGVSILSLPRTMNFDGEKDLLRQLRPHEDGVILVAGGRRGLFLPQVWSSLEEPTVFLAHLKEKAGLKADDWPAGIRALRFSTESF